MNKTTALVFLNLGTPASPSKKDVRDYLKEFLMDPYVIDIPTIFRWLLVKGIIAPFRSAKSAHAYQKIWTDKGSPLLVNSENFYKKARVALLESNAEPYLAMRYGRPSLESVFSDIASKNFSRIVVVPLYPQYALSSTETGKQEALRLAKKWGCVRPEFYPPFYREPSYINGTARLIKGVHKDFNPDFTLFSYHGLPKRHISKLSSCEECTFDSCCDNPGKRINLCYRAQCYETTRRVVEKLGLSSAIYKTSFQSRLGKGWVEPYTDEVVLELAHSGVRRLAIACPAFVADCLETLEEVSMGLRQTFVEAGGEDLCLVPCLNDEEFWVKEFSGEIQQWLVPKN